MFKWKQIVPVKKLKGKFFIQWNACQEEIWIGSIEVEKEWFSKCGGQFAKKRKHLLIQLKMQLLNHSYKKVSQESNINQEILTLLKKFIEFWSDIHWREEKSRWEIASPSGKNLLSQKLKTKTSNYKVIYNQEFKISKTSEEQPKKETS